MTTTTQRRIQWHPAFYACMQIEFEAEKDKLSFEPEHLLSKKPMQMDALIIKLEKDKTIQKNIGRLFRTYNVIEYKEPDDYLSVNDFYKVYGYCCFYQSDTEKISEISPEELTITFICNHYPRAMIQHLKKSRHITVKQIDKGIYYLENDPIPMQLLITKELDPVENQWLQHLRNNVKTADEITSIIQDYENHKHSKLYQAAMNVITRANWDTIKEEKEHMCEALRELMAEEFEQEHAAGEEIGKKIGSENERTQIIRTAYKNLKSLDAVSKILGFPIDVVKKAIS